MRWALALVALGAPWPVGAAAAALVAMSTSPVITMAAVHEARPRGQVAERLLMMSAINSVLAMLALKLWPVLALRSARPATELVDAAGQRAAW